MRVQLADDEKVRVIAKEKYSRCEAKGSLSDTMCLVSSSKSDKTYEDATKSKRVHAALYYMKMTAVESVVDCPYRKARSAALQAKNVASSGPGVS